MLNVPSYLFGGSSMPSNLDISRVRGENSGMLVGRDRFPSGYDLRILKLWRFLRLLSPATSLSTVRDAPIRKYGSPRG